MATHKNFDKVCCVVLALCLALTALYMNGESLGLQAAAREMGYESRLFDTASVHTIDIVMEDWKGFLETAQREEYSLCSLVIDGETYENVAIRGKGNTSLTQVEQYGNSRYSFKVEFDHYDTALVNYPIDTPVSGGTVDSRPMLAWIFSSEEYTQLYHQYFSQFLAEWLDSGAFAQAFQQVVDLITPYVEKDPTKFCTTEEFQAGVEALEDFCLLRAQSVQGQLEGTIPSTDDGQSADSSSLVDASSVDISAMGTMNNGGGGQRSWERGMGQSQEAVEGAGMSAATQDSAGQAPAIPQGQEDMGSPPELPSGEGPQEVPGQAAPDSASSATEESPSSEVESSSGEGDTSSGEESPSAPEEQAAPEEAGGATGQEPPTQPAEGAADAGIEAQPGALGQGQSQASSATEQWVLLEGSFLALGIGLAVAGLYRRKG